MISLAIVLIANSKLKSNAPKHSKAPLDFMTFEISEFRKHKPISIVEYEDSSWTNIQHSITEQRTFLEAKRKN